MDALYNKTKSSFSRIHEDLTRFERACTADETRATVNELNRQFDEILASLDKLDIYVSKEPVNRRADTKYKVDQLKYDFRHLQAAYKTLQYKREQRHLEEKRREELLSNTYTANGSNGNTDTSLQLGGYDQNELRHHNRLQTMNKNLDDMLDHGENVLDNVKAQQLTLKSVKTKILNIGNSLGMSQTVMRLIQQRSATDRKIVYALMALTCFIMFLTIYYFKR